MENVMERLFRPEVVWVLIPVIALIVWGGVEITQSIIRHRERIAMIEQGMHPDHPDHADEDAERDAA
ncbi:MAG: hypothetical protein ACF8XB_05280 [Planctomycetota bacterium JB042]